MLFVRTFIATRNQKQKHNIKFTGFPFSLRFTLLMSGRITIQTRTCHFYDEVTRHVTHKIRHTGHTAHRKH